MEKEIIEIENGDILGCQIDLGNAPDRPKILKDILTVLSSINANVQSIYQDGSTTSVPVGFVKITLTFQVLGKEQIDYILTELNKKDFKCELCC
jgi:(p)ppGpp synthase/HD superfamily hydrolase